MNIIGELNNRINHRMAIEIGTFGMKFKNQKVSARLRKEILSFIDSRYIQNPPFKNVPIKTGMDIT